MKQQLALRKSNRDRAIRSRTLCEKWCTVTRDLELILDPFEMTHPGIAGATLLKKIKRRGTSPPLCLQYKDVISK